MTTNAQSAAIGRHRMATAWRGLSARFRGRATSGSAPITETTQSCAGGLQMPALPLEVLIHQRAERVCNRNPALVAKYIRLQTILGRGR